MIANKSGTNRLSIIALSAFDDVDHAGPVYHLFGYFDVNHISSISVGAFFAWLEETESWKKIK